MKFGLPEIFIMIGSCVLALAAAGAAAGSDTVFSDNEIVTASVLDTVSSGNTVTMTFDPGSSATFGGNEVGGGAFAGAIGINAVNQNSAVSATVQQVITVNGNLPVVTLPSQSSVQ